MLGSLLMLDVRERSGKFVVSPTNLGEAKLKMKNQTFTASIWREDDWFIAQCLEIDIASQGESEEVALVNLSEALELYFESPQPSLKPVIRKFEAKVGAA
jgi:predicted RNase H-like HicB family nuclease